MKKLILLVATVMVCGSMAFADDNNKTIKQETTTCTTVGGSVFGNGGSTKTCVTDRPDGSRTTTVTSCKTTGASASVGVAKGGFTRETCTTTTINETKSSNSSSNSNSNNNNSNNNNSKK